MLAEVRGTTIYFDVEGAGLVPEGPTMRERPVAMVIHGGPGGDHTGFKPAMSPLTDAVQLIYFDHRGQGRSGRGNPARYTLDENVEDMEALRRHLGLGPVVSMRIPMHSAHPYRFQTAHRSNLKPPTVLTMPPTLFG